MTNRIHFLNAGTSGALCRGPNCHELTAEASQVTCRTCRRLMPVAPPSSLNLRVQLWVGDKCAHEVVDPRLCAKVIEVLANFASS